MGGVSESGLSLVQGAGEGGAAALVFRWVAKELKKNYKNALKVPFIQTLSLGGGEGGAAAVVFRWEANCVHFLEPVALW